MRLHMGYDRWWQQDKEVIALSQISDSQVRWHVCTPLRADGAAQPLHIKHQSQVQLFHNYAA